MPREQTRLIDRDLKFLVSETAQERALFHKNQDNARKRLHWTLGSIVAVFIGGWLSGSPIASIDERARTTNAGLLSSEDLFIRSATNYLADQTERFFASRSQPQILSENPSETLSETLREPMAVIELPIDLVNQASKLDDFDSNKVAPESMFVQPAFENLRESSSEVSRKPVETAKEFHTQDDAEEFGTTTEDAYNALVQEDRHNDLLEHSVDLPVAAEVQEPAQADIVSVAAPKLASLNIERKAVDVELEPAFKPSKDIGLLPPAINDESVVDETQTVFQPQTIKSPFLDSSSKELKISTAIESRIQPASEQEPELKTAAIATPEQQQEPEVVQEKKTEDEWLLVKVRKGDTLGQIFQRLGFSSKQAIDIAKIKSAKKSLRIKAGDRLWCKRDEQNPNRLDTLKLLKNKAEFLLVEAQDDGYKLTTEARELEIYNKHVFGSIKSSLYSAGLKAGLPERLILEMVSIYRWNIDFAKDLQPGDHFTVIYEEKFAGDEKVSVGNILAVEFVNRGAELRAIRHEDENGTASYFTPDGHSLRRAFLRNPLPFSRVTSKFSKNRYHPILKKWRAHKGVDYGAGRGTPIVATADGRVIHRGKKGGYGNTVILQHGNKYKTLYAHMSRFAKSIKNGSKVKQGQTIGYVGSSGYATGPHLHYEFRINGAHRDPLTVKLPRSLPIEKKYKADFLQYAGVWDERLSAVSNINVAKRN